MRVLFADQLPESCISGARAAGVECTVAPGLTSDELAASIPGHDALVVRSTRVTAEAVEASRDLGLIVRAGAGTNTIDVDAASAAGIQVANVPGQNAIAVAELTMGLLLAIDRRIADGVIDSRAGRWNKKTYSKARGLYGRTIGVVGLGAIGVEVAERARGFGMSVLVVSRPGRPADLEQRLGDLGARSVPSLVDLVSQSDVITVHVPAADDTRHLIGEELLGHARPGTILLNTARGDTIDESALLRALDERDLWVGLDVYPDEPSEGEADFDSALASHPRVYGTHHIGASTEQAQEAVGDGVVHILEAYASGSAVPNVVNLADQAAAATLVIRHRNRVGVLSDVLSVLRTAGLNVEDMANRIFTGGEAAMATIHVGNAVDKEITDGVRRVKHVLSVVVT